MRAPARYENTMALTKLHVGGLLVSLCVLGACLIASGALHRGEQQSVAKASPPLVRTALARRTDVEVASELIGTVLASGTVNVQTQTSGKLVAARFTEGQFVRRGDILFEIDPRPAQAALQQAESMLAKDEATLANAERDARRYAVLFNQNSVSTQVRDQAVAASKAAEATANADRASVQIARLNLEYTEIRSPVDGKTGAIQVQPGNIVYATGGQGTSTLVTITELQPVKISFFLPQSDMQLVLAQAKGRSVRIAYSVPNSNGAQKEAPADFVDSTVDSQSGTVEFRALIGNEDLALWPGETLNVRVRLERLRNVIVVPREAVNSAPEGDYVYAVNRNERVLRIPVVLLNDDGSSDAVSGPLTPGERVVTEGQFRIAPGMSVSVMSRPAPPVSVSDAGDVR